MKEPREVKLISDGESWDETTGKHRWIRVLGWGPGLGRKIWSGSYKLVYGTPRKLWDPQKPEKPLFEAYEIEGEFDADTIQWKWGKMKVKNLETGEINTFEIEDWSFSLYEGDKLYFSDGTLLLSCKFVDTKEK